MRCESAGAVATKPPDAFAKEMTMTAASVTETVILPKVSNFKKSGTALGTSTAADARAFFTDAGFPVR